MTPLPGDRLQRHVGDHVQFVLEDRAGASLQKGWKARLRTNIGRAERLRREIIQAHTRNIPAAGASWHDLAMKRGADGWSLELPLAEVGYFQAKAFLIDPRGWQFWPEGGDVGITVHPDSYRTANTIYCAFTRLFGRSRTEPGHPKPATELQLRQLEQQGFAVLPPSGKLRDLVGCLPHIFDTLGCRILHLLPVNPTPTTYARFGRFGSPYAALDLTGIDPALVVFDKRTTGVGQFVELTTATHKRGGRVFLDLVINHTGWGSSLHENSPNWFLRNTDGTFASPGAWGTTWEDLVELKHDNVALWDRLAHVFLTWCRRGVDGFRCDAGYMVPVHAWQYIIARVRQEFTDALFLLEGLGGAWETTASLLTDGGMQWAYSELFQNHAPREVAGYLDHSIRQSDRVGLLVHYSETHDNTRLAARSRAWSLLRNRLSALTGTSGAFGFTCGSEWLATEKINVHSATELSWGNKDNIIPELARLNRLLEDHPCFFDGARLTRLTPPESHVYALLRESAEGKDRVLVLVNNDTEKQQVARLKASVLQIAPAAKSQPATAAAAWSFSHELLGQSAPSVELHGGEVLVTMPAAAVFCLSTAARPSGLSGEAYRQARAHAAWALKALSAGLSVDDIGSFDWRILARLANGNPVALLAAISRLPEAPVRLEAVLEETMARPGYSNVIRWAAADCDRITPVPTGHWLLIVDPAPFRAHLRFNAAFGQELQTRNMESIRVADGHIACFAPVSEPRDATLRLEVYGETTSRLEAKIRFIGPGPERALSSIAEPPPDSLVLLTNGIGGMARLCVDLGRVRSKYDCVLGANLHPDLPVDRHVFAKRIRVWVNADGFISALDLKNLVRFEAGPPATWRFVANAGDGRTVEIRMRAAMAPGRNTTVFDFSRPSEAQATGKQLPAEADVRLTVRVDIEDRNFHWETRRNGGAEHHFASHTQTLEDADAPGRIGFQFTPTADRRLRVYATSGQYHAEPEWCEQVPHPVEQSRGQQGTGDAYSPGWFDLPLPKGGGANLIVTAEAVYASPADLQIDSRKSASTDPAAAFNDQLLLSARAFVVRRGSGKTVIAGYPWFLDWGRDTLICARGLLAAGFGDDVTELLLTFARFEKSGTLPNTIHGEDASNRDTSDAPLWFGIVCEDVAGGWDANKGDFYSTPVDRSGRTLRDVLRSIAEHCSRGTPNGIRMDTASALIWSPSHFTWMDTNYPAGTPREGYPVEIQALWIRLLRQLGRIDEASRRPQWNKLAETAVSSFENLFWLEDLGWYADFLSVRAGKGIAQASASDALRSNCLFPVSLGVAHPSRARRCVEAARRHLVIPGALRSLAPLPVSMPLPVHGNDGHLLNDPMKPYWGRYEGDEDTRRKPAYHNGTAWTWTFPVFCEALARAWDFAPDAVSAARSYLGSMSGLMEDGCLGQIPEVLDGDAPHTPRGCDAQAWGVTEAIRVWKLLESLRV